MHIDVMRAVNLRSFISVYQAGDAYLFGRYVAANGICDSQQGMRKAEVEDIISFADFIEQNGADVGELDNFYIGYSIPQIGKEFDLLRFGVNSVVNIEIKQTAGPERWRGNYYVMLII